MESRPQVVVSMAIEVYGWMGVVRVPAKILQTLDGRRDYVDDLWLKPEWLRWSSFGETADRTPLRKGGRSCLQKVLH
jgi:hypothetical protein